MRGILIALPLITILAALLSEADPIFSEWLKDLIELLRLEKLPEYILRLVLIYFLLVAAVVAVFNRDKLAPLLPGARDRATAAETAPGSSGSSELIVTTIRLSSRRCRLPSRSCSYSSAVTPSTPTAPSLRVRRYASFNQSMSIR